jgi:peptide/nickel transport system ATP-binding protein
MYAGKLMEKASTEVITEAPLHPYTQALIASLPAVGVRHDEVTLTGIPGRPPSLASPPAGCRFRDRCPFAFGMCAQAPPFGEVQPGHLVACWKVSQEQGSAAPVVIAEDSAAEGSAAEGPVPEGAGA